MIGWINKLIYRSAKFSESYDSDYLWPAEKILFEEIPENSRIADLGVGAGRTTKYLLPKASYYKCFDVSANYINKLKAKHIGVNAEVKDFNCSDFFTSDEQYDVVIISFNSLDYINHKNRISLLNQIVNVLSDGGVLIFSSHNYHYKIPDKSYSFLVRFYRLIAKIFIFKKQTTLQEIKYVQDSGLKGTLITYYISVREQLVQIENIFGLNVKTTVFDKSGVELSPNDYTMADDKAPWYYYKIEKV